MELPSSPLPLFFKHKISFFKSFLRIGRKIELSYFKFESNFFLFFGSIFRRMVPTCLRIYTGAFHTHVNMFCTWTLVVLTSTTKRRDECLFPIEWVFRETCFLRHKFMEMGKTIACVSVLWKWIWRIYGWEIKNVPDTSNFHFFMSNRKYWLYASESNIAKNTLI